ncbi:MULTISPECIES: hypothetical protein [unclassified Siphonobacter]|uniref:hypothetical protein n=1 Tax=unclassified Siphonobacter TaxID=2635712 RepID=UPI000CCA4B8B|nr:MULTISPECIES: hypothetical protein [unclassified Siphonobacter]MDQ1086671.1 2,3-bisphosphoglycerate-independent phosphoglycerate mutase [Siphonobacter sp. SORGH_AS_1065]MDR6196933.1 2,3-bisphosphoglycerate-independent phosphoglycerate mutase [Siphonobacter sp. SORGH_AS_0500]PKK36189.1 hypothetical protein BWI96_12300 [Siphonobacter sp. SORGH_AS_0500]
MKPTKYQINKTIAEVVNKLERLGENPVDNFPEKEGLQEVQAILKEGRTRYSSISKLKTRQARAMALLAVDYVNGGCSAHSLMSFK